MESTFDRDDIKELLNALKISPDEELVDRLAQGKESPVLENVFLNNTYQDGKLKLFVDSNLVLKFKFDQKLEQLIIPEKILSHKLSKQEIEDLENNKTVLIKNGESVLGIAVDKELNKVSIKGESKLGLLKELGGYEFSIKEQESLLNGGSVGPRIFYDKKEKRYLQASIAFTEDGKGVKFSGIKEIEKEKAQELIQKLNLKENEISSLANITSQVLEQAKTKEIELKDFTLAIANKDYEKLESLQEHKLKPEQLAELKVTNAYKSLTRAEQIAVDKIMNTTVEQAANIASPGELETANRVVLEKGPELGGNDKSFVKEPTLKEITSAIEKKDFAGLEKFKDLESKVAYDLFASETYKNLDSKEQKAVNFLLNTNPDKEANIKILGELEKFDNQEQFPSIKVIEEVLDSGNKISSSTMSKVETFAKEHRDLFKPEIADKFEEKITEAKSKDPDLSPQVQNLSIPKSKGVRM